MKDALAFFILHYALLEGICQPREFGFLIFCAVCRFLDRFCLNSWQFCHGKAVPLFLFQCQLFYFCKSCFYLRNGQEDQRDGCFGKNVDAVVNQ